MTRTQNFVVFISPGTLFSETTTKPIESWSIEAACSMADGISERHGSKPFRFMFETKIISDPIDDGQGGTLDVEPKTIKSSAIHYLGGVLLTIEDVKARNDPKNDILIRNMECNNSPIVLENTNSYRSTLPFHEDDVVVDPNSGVILERGDTPERKFYRKIKKQEHEAALQGRL